MNLTRELTDTLRIPTLSASVLKIRELLAREDIGTSDVATALGQDPPLAVKVLRIANSVQFGAREPRTSIQAATSVLGLRTVASIVLRAGVVSSFENLADTPEFSVTSIWKHSILTAHAAEDLARMLRRRSSDFAPQDYYTCGLLHDIGEIVLFDNFGPDYARLVTSREPGQSQVQAEADGLLGLNHAEVGGLAAGMWRLPAPIPDLIRLHHHDTVRGSMADVVSLITCADRISQLVVEHPTEEVRTLAGKLERIPAGCTPAIIQDVLELAKRHYASIEL